MRVYLKGGVVLATHADEQNIPASAYGADVEMLQVEPGRVVTIGEAMADLGLDDRKATLLARIDAKRNAEIAAGYQHNFGASAGVRTLDCRTTEDQTNWLALHGLWSALDPEMMVEVIDAGNAVFETSAATGASAILALGQWKSALIVHARNLKNEALGASDDAGLDAIDIDEGWPAD